MSKKRAYLTKPQAAYVDLVQELRSVLMAELQIQSLTKEELAKRAGMSPQLIGRVLAFDRNPRIKELGAIAHALGGNLQVAFVNHARET
jgi:transcriptional regulator with XRE-family HTH domain